MYKDEMQPEERRKSIQEDAGLWALPMVREKKYRPPAPDAHSTDTVPLDSVPHTESGKDTPQAEPIPPRAGTDASPAHSIRPADRVPAAGYRTASYNTAAGYREARLGFSAQDMTAFEEAAHDTGRKKAAAAAGETLCERIGTGWLLRRVTVRRWINDFSFYSRFAADAEVSHEKKGDPASPPVPFFSYVPQYSQMNQQQIAYYLRFRDNARTGVYLACDLSYVLLYVFEILNLPHRIPPENGIQLLGALWAHYRTVYPRLDTYLSEWVPDYCMIHGVTLPDSLVPFIGEIVRKAQFKEFYLDVIDPNNPHTMSMLADIFTEAYSDYDFRKSRYYLAAKEAYEQEIPGALAAVLSAVCREKRGIFALDHTYRLTRDAYAGAIAQTESKRRLDITFQSCIRSPATRKFVTGIVKYAENRLRGRLRIKSKLNAADISPADKAIVDLYFGSDPPAVSARKAEAEPAYLRQYEADSTGFNWETAGQIEAASWRNTSRLTEEFADAGGEPVPDDCAEAICNAATATDAADEAPAADTPVSSNEPSGVPGTDGDYVLEKAAVRALLTDAFSSFCREKGVFPGRMADTINEIFLDTVGDILIEADGNSFRIVEEYREEAETWSKT